MIIYLSTKTIVVDELFVCELAYIQEILIFIKIKVYFEIFENHVGKPCWKTMLEKIFGMLSSHGVLTYTPFVRQFGHFRENHMVLSALDDLSKV